MPEITTVIGSRGLRNIGGLVQEEYLAILKGWPKEVKTLLEMRDDVVISTLLDAIKLPLLAADFDTVPAGETPGDDEAREFLLDNMNGMFRQSWRAYVGDCLEALDFGFAVGEVVMEKRDDGRLWLRNIEPRGQETLFKWGFDDPRDKDVATSFVQWDPDTGARLTIPLEKCVHVVFRGRKGNPQGRSLLRTLFWPWRFMRNLQNLEAIGIERDVGGMPVLKLPEGGITDTQNTDLKATLKAIRQDEEAYLILPHGVEIAPYGGGNKLYDVAAVIDRYKTEILMRGFAQFLKLGMERVGTQALVKGSQDFFSLGLIAIQQELLDIWNQQLVPLLFRHNRIPTPSGFPTITWANPGKVDLGAVIDGYVKGVGARLLTPIREDEEKVRALMDFPDLPEGEGEGPRLPIEQPPLAGLFERQEDNGQNGGAHS